MSFFAIALASAFAFDSNINRSKGKNGFIVDNNNSDDDDDDDDDELLFASVFAFDRNRNSSC